MSTSFSHLEELFHNFFIAFFFGIELYISIFPIVAFYPEPIQNLGKFECQQKKQKFDKIKFKTYPRSTVLQSFVLFYSTATTLHLVTQKFENVGRDSFLHLRQDEVNFHCIETKFSKIVGQIHCQFLP